jgi:GAF domain-containing protein
MLCSRLANELHSAEACLFTPLSSEGVFAVACATDGIREAVSSLRLPAGEGLTGWVAINRHTIINSHADLDLGPLAAKLGLKACTAIPVFALGELVGVLAVYVPVDGGFSAANVRVVTTLAQEIGMAIAKREAAFGDARGIAAKRAS